MTDLAMLSAVLTALLSGAALGAVLLWWSVRGRVELAVAAARAVGETERALLIEKLRVADIEQRQLRDANDDLRKTLSNQRQELEASADKRLEALELQRHELADRLDAARSAITELRERNGGLVAELKAEREQAGAKLAVLSDARSALVGQFQQLANDILEEKSQRFAAQNKTHLGQLLDPLRERIKDFQEKVEDVYVKETKDRSALAEQVKQLLDLNRMLSDDARNLTSALKGSNKAQGNWGELVLERILESSGLRRGHDYEAQEIHTREDGTRAQPDVIIHLPGERYLVIDAKVSLTAYEAYVASDDDKSRAQALSRHSESVRSHIRGLSPRNYQDIYGGRSFDCVLMFVAIEPAFMLAIGDDEALFTDAWQRNVLLVSPSTLLFALRTIAHLWRQEAQSNNAQLIAQRGAQLFDRLSAFVEDLERVGERLQMAQDSFLLARDKLSRNKGNVIRQAEMLRELGVKPNRLMPASMLHLNDDDDALPLAAPDG